MVNKVQICEALAKSGTRYAPTALAMPFESIYESIKYMNIVRPLRGLEIQGYIDESGNYKNYKTNWDPEDASEIKARRLETYHLQYEAAFDPESLMTTVFGKTADKIPMLTNEMVKKIAVAKMEAISENLNPCIWTGVRNENGTGKLDNFDGFATIISKEIAAGNIGLSKGNYAQMGGVNKYNIGVKLTTVWNRRDRKIKRADLFIEDALLVMYNQWYRDQNFNNANTDTDGAQQFLIGTEKKCRLVSCPGMEGMGYIIITDGKKNMKVGLDGIGTGENATGTFLMRADNNPKVVQMFTDMWMGVNFTMVDKRFLMTASYNLNDESVYATVDPENYEMEEVTVGETDTVEVDFQGYNLTSSTAVTISGTGLTADVETITAEDANADGGKTVTVTFTPLAAGVVNGVLRFVNATDDVDLTVHIKATGKAASV